ncbi:hypothetical protein NY78_3028 [Desulfovibrio sp. TomC]|nr:hypothetical protein NY78_3028 [Desulfovibrio sp. TomC]
MIYPVTHPETALSAKAATREIPQRRFYAHKASKSAFFVGLCA